MIIVDTTVEYDVHIAEDSIVSFTYSDLFPHNWGQPIDKGTVKYSGQSSAMRCTRSDKLFNVKPDTFYSVTYYYWSHKVKNIRELTQKELDTFSWGVHITTIRGYHACYFNSKLAQLELVEKIKNAIELREYALRTAYDVHSLTLHRLQGE